MTTIILAPAPRPSVRVERGHRPGGPGWRAYCTTGLCAWVFGSAAATHHAVAAAAGAHRRAHRDAMPEVEDVILDGDRPACACACGWTTPLGFTSVEDRRRTLRAHLVDDHGAVL